MTPIWYGPDNSGKVARFVAENIPGCSRGWDRCVALGVYRDGQLCAGVVYHDFNPEAALMSLSAYSKTPRWCTPKVLFEIFNYPLNIAGCQMVVLQVSEFNKHMLSIARKLGCDMVRVPRGRGRIEDEIICTLTDDVWRASKIVRRYGQRPGTRAA